MCVHRKKSHEGFNTPLKVWIKVENEQLVHCNQPRDEIHHHQLHLPTVLGRPQRLEELLSQPLCVVHEMESGCVEHLGLCILALLLLLLGQLLLQQILALVRFLRRRVVNHLLVTIMFMCMCT